MMLEYRSGGGRIQVRCGESGGRLLAMPSPAAGHAERTLARGLAAYMGRCPPEEFALLMSALRSPRATSLDAALACAPPDQEVLANAVRAAATGGDRVFSVAEEILDALAQGAIPVVGVAAARILAEAGYGQQALDWLNKAHVTGEPARHVRGRLASVLRVRDPKLAGPAPRHVIERLMWIESLVGTERSGEALAVAREVVKERPDLAVEAIERVAPWAEDAAKWVEGDERALALSRFALWRGDYAEAEAQHRDLGNAVSAATRVGFLLLSGRGDAAAVECQRAVERWPEHQELALWQAECLLRAGQLREAREFGDRAVRVVGSHPVARLHRALCGLDTLGDPNVGAATHYFHRSVIRQLLPNEPVEEGEDTAERKQVWRALAQLHGNRSEHLTVTEDGELRPARIREPRTEVVRIQHQAVVRTAQEVQDELRRFDIEFPGVPFGPTYSAELDLFVGEYEKALRVFDRSWKENRTRWSYVGSGAALVMLERYDEALQRFDDGERVSKSLIPGEATHAYRGEVLLRLGRLDEALPHLEYAFEVEPRRIGADLVLAQLYRALGRHEDQERVTEIARRLAPCLWYEASRAQSNTLDVAVAMLRGNRSSHILTFFDLKERCRVLPLWNTGLAGERLASRFTGPVYGDELWAIVEASYRSASAQPTS